MSTVGSWFFYAMVYLSGVFGAVIWFYINKPRDMLSSRILCAVAICAITAFIAYIFCQIFLSDYFDDSHLAIVSMILSMAASYRFHVVVNEWWHYKNK